MKNRRYISVCVVVAALAVCAGSVQAKTRFHIGLSIGGPIGHSIVAGGCRGPIIGPARHVRTPHGGACIRSPLRHRVFAVQPRYYTIVVGKPSVEPVVVAPAVVTVWIRNSNGSQSPVELRPSGPGYIGPKGEYYTVMPDNEQLRMVYGF
ncbi:MAG: hypothetical protein JW720_07425 [Sedimentisphaerales bacterium]|nr:hypothetical protein [Sedimentisphaerales bacterium]